VEVDVVSSRVLVVEHQASCPPALFGEWLAEAGVELEVCRPWAGDDLPDLAADHGYDGVLVLGGEMGAHDDDAHHWLGPLKQGLRAAAAAEVPLLGICLGHQLLAVALGGDVARNPHGQAVGLLETGWEDAAASDPLTAGLALGRRGIQWNNDVVTALPPGSTVLARTPEGDLQVVRFAPSAWGVQLHPEADLEVVRAWAEGDRADHLERGIDQEAVLAAIDAARAELDDSWRPLAHRFAALCAQRAEQAGRDRVAP
jgi:GMP synthase (glutamine-hydrolysing)